LTYTGIPADVLEQFETELEFLEAAEQAVMITAQMAEQRHSERIEAEEASERADNSWQAAQRALELAEQRMGAILKRHGLVRAADGIRLADPGPDVDPFAPVIDDGQVR
jgi:hypothetical protein